MYDTGIVKDMYVRGSKTIQELAVAYDIPERVLFRRSTNEDWIKQRKEFRNRIDIITSEKTAQLKAKEGVIFSEKLRQQLEELIQTKVKRLQTAYSLNAKLKSLEASENSLCALVTAYQEIIGKKFDKPTIIQVIPHYDSKSLNQDRTKDGDLINFD